ncbi:MAG: hypothetical protein AAFR68_13015, partial [Pseudomonadota bacterium]
YFAAMSGGVPVRGQARSRRKGEPFHGDATPPRTGRPVVTTDIACLSSVTIALRRQTAWPGITPTGASFLAGLGHLAVTPSK